MDAPRPAKALPARDLFRRPAPTCRDHARQAGRERIETGPFRQGTARQPAEARKPSAAGAARPAASAAFAATGAFHGTPHRKGVATGGRGTSAATGTTLPHPFRAYGECSVAASKARDAAARSSCLFAHCAPPSFKFEENARLIRVDFAQKARRLANRRFKPRC